MCYLKGKWQPPRVSTGILTAVLSTSSLRTGHGHGPGSIMSSPCPGLAFLLALSESSCSCLPLVLVMNQFKDALKLPLSTDFYKYLVEWPCNLSSRMELFWDWKRTLLIMRLGQWIYTRYVPGNLACHWYTLQSTVWNADGQPSLVTMAGCSSWVSGLSLFPLHAFLACVSVLRASNRVRAFKTPFDGMGSRVHRWSTGSISSSWTTYLFLVCCFPREGNKPASRTRVNKAESWGSRLVWEEGRLGARQTDFTAFWFFLVNKSQGSLTHFPFRQTSAARCQH